MHRRLCVVKNKYDWLYLTVVGEDEISIKLASKNGSQFVVDYGDGTVETVSNDITHTYATPYTGSIKIRMVTGNIKEELLFITFLFGHFNFDLSVFNDFDAFEYITVNDVDDTMTISGDLSISSVLTNSLILTGNNLNITGDISDAKHLTERLTLIGSNIDATYTTTTWTQIPNGGILLDLKPNQLTSQELDQLLQDLDANKIVGTATLDFRGSNEPPTYNAYSSISSLEGKGFTVLVNEAD